MKPLQLILDADDVCADTTQKALDWYNRKNQTDIKIEQVLDWDLSLVQKPGTNIASCFEQPGFFRELPVKEMAPFYIQKLIEDGHNVVIATSSSKNGIMDKIDWFEEHFPFIPFQNIIPITRKDLLKGDIMLDDAPHNLKTSQCRYPVIFDNYWNRNTEGSYAFLKGLKRIYSWKEFYEFVCEVAQKEKPELQVS
ncbi:hypothetical protein PP175_27715 (plasmid) [Aneurinibacillus sp. Ricciae_BoGa-3]|uniref:5' nucleotidase, NT5C type n=1 Tax=Aneurinibacillus sp. Ricciae_BoGa-3 TaxID=3022697 RepID=UPI00233F7E5D|nr:hypothetical protein [Aneurinibacillus sp. Ricciae_BoGa-3]WCK56981.1 hypothetical protein PP175_27715 [Aneurinibacillus sp. Ricciae_BoGa-3]